MTKAPLVVPAKARRPGESRGPWPWSGTWIPASAGMTIMGPRHPGESPSSRRKPGHPGESPSSRRRPAHPGESPSSRRKPVIPAKARHPGESPSSRRKPGSMVPDEKLAQAPIANPIGEYIIKLTEPRFEARTPILPASRLMKFTEPRGEARTSILPVSTP